MSLLGVETANRLHGPEFIRMGEETREKTQTSVWVSPVQGWRNQTARMLHYVCRVTV